MGYNHTKSTKEHCRANDQHGAKEFKVDAYQATLPTMLTNLSRSAAPAHATKVQATVIKNLKMFFSHLTFVLCLPDFEKRPFSIMRTAGKLQLGLAGLNENSDDYSCKGVESMIATE